MDGDDRPATTKTAATDMEVAPMILDYLRRLSSVMRGALLAAGLILVTAGAWFAPQAGSAAQEQENPRLASLDVAIWPEFDSSGQALVILRGVLADDVSLPATVAVRIPTASGGPHAVASGVPADEGLFNLSYTLADDEDFTTVTFTTPDPLFSLEFYESMLLDGDNRSYAYDWPGDLAADELTLEVQEPVGSTSLLMGPELGDSVVDSHGVVVHRGQMGPLESGETLTMNVSYVKTDPRTSAEILGILGPPTVAQESDDGFPTWVIIVAVVVALAFAVAVAVYWRWQVAPAAAPSGPAAGRRRRGRSDAGQKEDATPQAFCTQCGHELGSSDSFCPKCGAPRRE
jgi:hypothetical protein